MKYSTKLFLSVFLLLAAAITVCCNILILSSFCSTHENEIADAEKSYRLTYYALSAVGGPNPQPDKLAIGLQDLAMDEGDSVLLLSGDEVIYASESSKGARSEAPDADPDKDELKLYCYSDDKGDHYIQIAARIPSEIYDLKLIGRYRIENAYSMLNAQQKIYVIVNSASFLVCAAVLWVLKIWLTRPLDRLSNAANAISSGDYSVRADDSGNDEFARLAESFNSMTDKLVGEMEKQREFTAAFAHEIKTPMTSVIGYADLLRSGGLNEEEQIRAANTIFAEGKRMEGLSFKLLDLLMTENLENVMKVHDIGELAEKIYLEMLPLLKEKGIDFSCKCDHIDAICDPELLKIMIMNFIDNSSKAVAARKGSAKNDDYTPTICLMTQITTAGYMISVRDNGCGIPEGSETKVFEPFYRVDKSRSRALGGAGLGLSLARRIAEAHNGTIRIESHEGEGTLIEFEAPRMTGEKGGGHNG